MAIPDGQNKHGPMKNILLIPIQTDALYLSQDTLITGASVDFSTLPYFNGTRDVNADVANISENVISQPLQDQNLRLRKGLHLHWALPDALNRGRHKEDGRTDFPTVPNRWMVTRQSGSEVKSWVVESDFLFPEEKDLLQLPGDDPQRLARRESVTVPVEIAGRESGEQPFRYMGRKVDSKDYSPRAANQADRYPNLTTVGYGEPSFAAFYPNCHSVFGYHDPDIDENSGSVTYEIIGWYSSAKNDFFKKLTERTVVIAQQDFVDNFPDITIEKAEELWIDMLRFGMLDDRIAKESPAEQALIVPPNKWPRSQFNFGTSDTTLIQAIKILRNAIEQHIGELAGWVVQPVISKIEWLTILQGQPGEELWQAFHQAGWLKALPGNPKLAIVVGESERKNDLPDIINDANRLEFEKLMLSFYLQRAPEQVLFHSRIEVDTTGVEGKLPQDEADGLSVVIGNTGTEALSAFLAEKLAKPVEVDTQEFANMIPRQQRQQLLDGFQQAGWIRVDPDRPKVVTIVPKSERPDQPLPPGLEEFRVNFENVLKVFGKSFAKKQDTPERTSQMLQLAEEQLEVLYLLDKFNHQVLDLDAKFDEARHENGFNSLAGGHLWTISVESVSNEPADARKEADKPKLPLEIADQLNKLNILQQQYDQAYFELESLGTQLYADWYKYMVSTYPPEDTRIDHPDIDEVRYFIETKVIAPLRTKDAETGKLILATPEEIRKGKSPASGKGGNSSATAKVLARAINQLFKKLNELNVSLPAGSSVFNIKRTGGPRYWEPKEPVVLLANDTPDNQILQPTARHGQDGRNRPDDLLACHALAFDELGERYLATISDFEKIRPALDSLFDPNLIDQVGYSKWLGQPWNPFRLDWEVELVPLGKGANLEGANYDPDFLTKEFTFELNDETQNTHYFTLPIQSPDLEPNIQTAAKFQGRNPNIYIGRSLLTPQAKKNLHGRLEVYLREHLLKPFLSENPGHAAGQSDDPFLKFGESDLRIRIVDNGGFSVENPVATALLAYLNMVERDIHLLSQSLSGFNDALLQLRQSFQLPIEDPIGFKDYQPFTEEVAQLAENSTHFAPQPLTDFNPIRNGKLVINQLRLVDTFGQKRDIGLGKLDRVLSPGPTPTNKVGSKIEVDLQPRLPQPARINFRWLSANEGTQEINAHPASTPICGWILTNQLDDSIVIYDAKGQMLGSIEAEADSTNSALAKWNTAPGAFNLVQPDEIANPFLKKMVAKIRSGGAAYVAQFLDGLDSVLCTIEPETFESQQALSLLIGRPIALVRASLNLELQGVPAVDQGWDAFYRDRDESDFDRNRDGFTKVKFPLRIGKFNQFNDGLVGYWKENGEVLDEQFLINQKPLVNIDHASIKFLNDLDIPIEQTLDSPPQLVSMLLDPRGKVHVTTGILPVKDISVPPDQYLPAMQRIGVTFLTTPLLSPARNIHSLLPKEEGFQWSWLETSGGENWREVFPYPTIDRAMFQRAFLEKIWAHLQFKNWIRPFFEDQFLVMPEEERGLLGGQFQQVEGEIFGLIEENTILVPLEDGSVEARISIKDFAERIAGKNDLGDKVWNLLVRSDVTWCQFIPDRPETYLIMPKENRTSHELADFGMEFLVEDILQNQSQTLREPTTAAQFGNERITIREGYLKLEGIE